MKILLVSVAMILSACANVTSETPVNVGEAHVRVGGDPPPKEALSEAEARDYAQAVLPFARLASRAYCTHLPQDGDPPSECGLARPLREADGWRGLFDASTSLPAEDRVTKLSFQAFYRMHADDETKGDIVFAFRGTRWTYLSDWNANFHWVTRFVPGRDQYDILHANVAKLIDLAIRQAGDRVAAERRGPAATFDVYTTGHSLGGGLAQLMAYSDERVKGAIVFDPSPVTGYFTNVEKTRANCNARILRVYERGEVLQYLRAMMRRLYTPTTNVAELDFNVIHTNGAGGFLNHSIVNFTDKLDKAAMAPTDEPIDAERIRRRQLMERFLPKRPDMACMDRKVPAAETLHGMR